MNLKPLELNDDFQYALDVLEKTKKSIFITGRAGTGKSTLLRMFRRTSRKKMVVLAPTGIAALNVKGQTIHSFCGFPPRFLTAKDIKINKRKKKLIQAIEVMVIDEISMVRADLLDAINIFLQKNRGDLSPFGGVQMVFIGDLFQLPPVLATDVERKYFEWQYDSPFFFSAKIMEKDFEMEMLELRKVYRQEARFFLRLLEAIRLNQADWEDLEDLNIRYLPKFETDDFFVTLSPRNFLVDKINKEELYNLLEIEYTFHAKIEGDFKSNQYPTEQILRLKKGAQVMFIRNDHEGGEYVNGTIGKVVAIDSDQIKVKIEVDGQQKIIEVYQVEWEVLKYKQTLDPKEIETEVLGTFTQYPLKLAWAVTIHKSQGKTFDKVIIDMGKGAFEHGQTYVALSRCRTLEGIVLKQKITPQDIMVDERIVDYYELNF